MQEMLPAKAKDKKKSAMESIWEDWEDLENLFQSIAYIYI